MQGAFPPAVVALTAFLAAACAGEAEDPGPHDIDGWIGQCEDRCNQEQSCDPNQLLFDHGDLDNCIYDCSYYLERDENVAFVEETPAACLEALYAMVQCAFGLGCEKLASWDIDDPSSSCGEKAAAARQACEGLEVASFLEDCGWSEDPDDAF